MNDSWTIYMLLGSAVTVIPFILWMWHWEEKHKRMSYNGICNDNSRTSNVGIASILLGTTVPSIAKKETS